MVNYLIVTIKSWNIDNFYKHLKNFKGKWYLISNMEEFTEKNIDRINPKSIFFIHWSWIIPKEIFEKYKCILFHLTDLPFGRGGSPLQNLIIRGIYQTKISALRVVQELDAGDIYLKRPIDIEFGTAEEIFKKTSDIIYDMIKEIINKKITPKPQKGEVIKFFRRTPEEGNLKPLNNLKGIYDYIRMLDSEGYPKAFLEINDMRYEFSNPILKNDLIESKVTIKKKKGKKNEE